jgi:hypothetical protein
MKKFWKGFRDLLDAELLGEIMGAALMAFIAMILLSTVVVLFLLGLKGLFG